MPQALRMLLVEDNPRDAELIVAELHRAGFAPDWQRVDTEPAYLAALDGGCDIILADYELPQFSGLRALELLQLSGRDIPLIVVSGTIGEDTAVAAMKQGATDYLLKGRLTRLAPAVNQALEQSRLRRERKQAEEARVHREAELKESQRIARIGSWEWTLATGVVTWSDGMNHVLVRDPRSPAPTFETLPQFYTPESWQRLSAVIARAVEAGVAYDLELEMIRTGGAICWTITRGEAIRGADGTVVKLRGTVLDITERKQAEEALRQSEERYRLLFQRTPDVIFALAPTGAIMSLNHAFETITGWPPAQWLGRPFQETIHPDDQTRAGELFQLVLRGERGPTVELRVGTAMGGHRDVEFIGFFSQLSGGRIEVQGIGRDITERKRAEAALYQSESEQRNLVKSLTMAQEVGNVGSWETDLATQEVRWSEQTHRIFETTPDTFKPTHAGFLEFVHPDDREAVDTAFLASADSRAPDSIEHRIVIRDGRIKHVEERWQTFANAKNHPVRAIGTCRDITEHKLAERQLREQNEILSNSHEGVVIVNLANQVMLWNRGAEEIFGWTAVEALGRVPEQLLGIDDPGAVSTLRTTAERGGFWNGELRAHARDGRKLILDCRVTLVRDKAGRPRARLNFLADITEKKLLEEKFLHAQRLESIGMLAAGIAHDLNNVLAPIVFAGPLLRGSLSAPRDLKILDTLEQSAGRGAGLVKQILGFVHSTTGEFQPTQVKHLMRDIVGVIEETFPKSIQFEHQIPSALWPVQGNATQIHQVLMNLCVNARDAMPSGGTLRITAANLRLDAAGAGAISGAWPGAWLVLEVADTGTGIPPEVLERIWTPFFTTKGAGKGTGLGLSTVRGIVVSHHGFVELHTEVGRGSTFRVFLPAIESESSRPSSASPFGILDGQGELILVVDDDTAIRGMVCQLLETHGYRSVNCADGVDAIALFNAHPGEISLVVTDVDMPRLGGGALAQALLQIRPDIRLLAMSGLSPNETNASDLPVIQKLAHAFLLKPFKPEDLLGTVHRLLHPIGKP